MTSIGWPMYSFTHQIIAKINLKIVTRFHQNKLIHDIIIKILLLINIQLCFDSSYTRYINQCGTLLKLFASTDCLLRLRRLR